jgi:hypothetical protein
VYGYEAVEENELTLREGDVVQHVQQVTEDWWSGETADGRAGLFPANYVELIQ